MSEQVSPQFLLLRWVVAIAVALAILVFYFYVHQYNVLRFDVYNQPYIDLTTPLDHWIPLIPAAYWLYCLFYLSVFAPVAITTTPVMLAEVAFAYLLVNAVGGLFWLLFPIRFVAPPVTCDGLTCDLIRALHTTDAGVNVFPSLHTAESVLAAVIFIHHRHRAAPWVTALAVGITASTVLIKNHYVHDLPPGVLLGLVAWPTARGLVAFMRNRIAILQQA